MAYVDPRLQGRPVPRVSVAEMARNNIAHLRGSKGSKIAFLDQRIPAYQREIVNMIGMGVVENVGDPDLAPKIKAPAQGFAVTYVRNTPRGHGAALHRHPTEEVFIALRGAWEVFWLEGEPNGSCGSTRATSSTCRSASIAASETPATIPRRH
jgi:hypothetical protein